MSDTANTTAPALMWRSATLARNAVLTLLAGLVSACGNLTAGGISETEVVISGDAADPVVAASPIMGAEMAQTDDDDADEAEGQIETDLLLYLESSTGTLVPLTPDPLEVRVDLQGVEEEGTTVQSVPAEAYPFLRIVFLDVSVEVDAGLIINGQPVTGQIRLELEGDSAVVRKPLNLQLDDGERAQILVDLNARTWLVDADPTLLTVPEQFFANAIEVRLR